MATHKPRLKQAAAAVFVPQNREQYNEAIRELGDLQRDLARISADMGDELAAVKEDYETIAEPYRQRVQALVSGLQTYSEAHRALLTDNYKVKTVTFTTGEVCWRLDTPSVRLLETEESVIAECEVFGFEHFIRRTPSLDKNAIKADPDNARKIEGLRITQNEKFEVKPFDMELAEVAS